MMSEWSILHINICCVFIAFCFKEILVSAPWKVAR